MGYTPASVAVVGSLNMDFIGLMEFHADDGTHRPMAEGYSVPGGHGGNQAVAVHRASHEKPDASDDGRKRSQSFTQSTLDFNFDVHVHLIAMVGDDKDGRGEDIRNKLEENQINIEGVSTISGVKTGYAHTDINASGVPRIRTFPGANGHLTADFVETWLPKTSPELILVQLEIPLQTALATIRWASSNKVPIIFNPAPVPIELVEFCDAKELFKVDHLVLNRDCADTILQLPKIAETEFQEQSSSLIQTNYIGACGKLHKLGAKCVVITLGSRGAIASFLEPADMNGARDQQLLFFGAKLGVPEQTKTNKIVDETGASDAFIGAYAAEILRQTRQGTSLDIGAALKVGIRAGGLTVAALGSMEAIPWRERLTGPDNSFIAAHGFEFGDDD
ncbi:ribokinase [Seiridium cupressi]